jgi:hypothetical protein
MNERIEKLAEQCRIETYGVNGELLAFGFDEEKFAELIVKECAGVGYDASYYECALNVSNKIKQHFGVEE